MDPVQDHLFTMAADGKVHLLLPSCVPDGGMHAGEKVATWALICSLINVTRAADMM